MKRVHSLAERVAKYIVDHTKTCLLISFIFLIALSSGLPKIHANYSVKGWLMDHDQRLLDLKEHEGIFGSSDTIDIMVYKEDGLFDENTIKTIQDITQDLWQIKHIVRVESLTNHNSIESEDDDIFITPFLDEEVELTPENLKLKEQLATHDRQLVNSTISKSGRFTYIRAFLDTFEGTPPYDQVVVDTEALLEKYNKAEGIKFYLGGISFINESLQRASDRDMMVVFPIVVGVLSLILFLFFRNLLGIVLPFSLVGLAIITTFGIEGHLGIELSSIIAALPAILIAIGLADSIHILITYRHFYIFDRMNEHDAAIAALKKNFIPTLLTTLTTAIGFFSLTSTDIKPIYNLGILSGIGTCIAWFYTYFFLGALLTKVHFKVGDRDDKFHAFDGIFMFAEKHKVIINILTPIITIASIYFGMQNYINADPIEYFDEHTPVKQAFNMVRKEFGGSRMIELVFDSEKPEGVKDPAFLKKSEELVQWMLKDEKIIRVSSILDIVKQMNKTLHSDNEEFYAIPETRRAVADQLFLYTLGLPQGLDLKNQLSLDNRRFRVLVMWDINDSTAAIAKTDKILKKADEIGIKIYEAGQSPIYNRVNDLVVNTLLTSMSISLPIIFLIILFVFKDLKLALLSLIPNVFPLSVAAGIMYFAGDELNIGNVIVFAVCLGIAVDDTIHFISNYKLKVLQGMNGHDALASTMHQTGKALALTTTMLTIAFGLFYLGDFVPNQKFGVYCSVILTLALVADLVILPAALLSLKSSKVETDTAKV
ncbi:efflux RND transporter permease subunit [Halobacteriovorax sp. GFR7]|uniref:efflux RND transporter permease subunit n=1 Tax=unclassified Halobacteriovorax TaxID=2639665 RepID=UPI00371692C6